MSNDFKVIKVGFECSDCGSESFIDEKEKEFLICSSCLRAYPKKDYDLSEL